MKKELLLPLLILPFSFGTALAQDCDLIKKNHDQLKTENTQLHATVKDVQTENSYLKEALKINSPLKEAESENVTFKILEVQGDKASQTITVTLLLNNKDANKALQFMQCRLVDVEGQVYSSNAKFDGNSVREELSTDVPIRAKLVFQKVLPKVAFAKLIEVQHYSTNRIGKVPPLEFRDIAITWK